jgi:hypothetical protein
MARAIPRLAGVCGAVAALLAGCVSADLSKDAKLTGDVIECLPPSTPDPVAIARAVWFPNARGFGSADESGHTTGVLALAGDSLWFMAWNEPEHHFDMRHVVALIPAMKVEILHLGMSALLVVQSGNHSFDSFELMNGGQLGSDPTQTRDLYEKVRALREKNPQPDL